MTLSERIKTDVTAAMRSGDALRRDVLRMAQNAIYNAEKRDKRTYTDDELIGVLAREVKTRRESVDAFRAGARPDLAEKEEAEIAILLGYLPDALDEAAIAALVGRSHRRDRRIVGARSREGHGLARSADPRPRRRQGRQRDGRRRARPGRPRGPRSGHGA